jgi:hypothetical protein
MPTLSGPEYEVISRIARALESIAGDLKKIANPLVVLRQEDAARLKTELNLNGDQS